MVTGPVKSVKSILSGLTTPNAPRATPPLKETVSKVRVRAGAAPKVMSPGAKLMSGC